MVQGILILLSLVISVFSASPAKANLPLCSTGDLTDGHVTLWVGKATSGRFHIETSAGMKKLFNTIDEFKDVGLCKTKNEEAPQCTTGDFADGHVTLWVGEHANGRFHIETDSGRKILFLGIREFMSRGMCAPPDAAAIPQCTTGDFADGHVTLFVGDQANGRFHIETDAGRQRLFAVIREFQALGLCSKPDPAN